ncbi:MAG: response regulator transcription factor, partial [Candidatus Kryptoniota bacterium]
MNFDSSIVRVALIEDNATFRSSVEEILNESSQIKVVSSLDSCNQIVPEYKLGRPDIALVDIGLRNNESGIDCARVIHNYFPETRIMMFTVFEDDDKIFDSICAGASGYLLKKTPPEEIIRALITLYEGGAPMTPSIANRTLELFRDKIRPSQTEWGLTPREKEILEYLAEGNTYQRIASKLFISISTVRT